VAEQALTSVLGGTQRGQILIPSAIVALNDPHFAGFSVEVEPFEERPYDGKFHPSMHATWTVRQLYLYLVAPLLLEPERRPLNNVLAVTAGRFWHRFFQQLWLTSGDLVLDEVALEDLPTNRVGHADGLLVNGEGLEIKTINEYQVLKITDEAALREKKFDYWAQSQDYLAMANWEVMRFFFVYPGWPFPMSEFVVKADAARQATRRSTYLQALELAAAHPDPDFLQDRNQAKIAACCSPGSAAAARCPVRLACPIGRAES
jgi:hypothetical protein